MELLLQFGYGMMDHSRTLTTAWGGGTTILSPRDLNESQLRRLARDLAATNGGRVLLDPQFYLPHADHERLCAHSYWPAEYDTNAFWTGPALTRLLRELFQLNADLGCREVVLPGLLADRIDDDWLAVQAMILEEARSLNTGGKPLIGTIALSSEALRSQEQIEQLIEDSESHLADGYYIVAEHPNGNYLVEEPNWLANVLDLSVALRLQGASVICGYCNQQMLILACAKVNAIASGTWMNVRSFPPDKFRRLYDEEIKQRATWYYCPQTMSEYKVPYLDIAYRQGLLGQMAPPGEYGSDFAAKLFGGPLPSSVGFSEQAAFRHYLQCLRRQAQAVSGTTFDQTVEAHETMLLEAEELGRTLTAAGVRGQMRDFTSLVDVNRAALAVLVNTRGAVLRRRWTTL